MSEGNEGAPPHKRPRKAPLVSILSCCHNGAKFLDAMLESLLAQTWDGPLELCVFDDASIDESVQICEAWRERLGQRGFDLVMGGHDGIGPDRKPGGIGFARNRVFALSKGDILLWQDVDDLMLPRRVELQVEAVEANPGCLVGCRFRREPEGSTERYTQWLNGLTQEGLMLQRFRELTVIAPTWAMSRKVIERAGPFSEDKAEDLIFFYQHIELGGGLRRVDDLLQVYRYHDEQASFHVKEGQRSFGVARDVILGHRVNHIEKMVIQDWESFTIWGNGKLGRQFFAKLSPEARKKVKAFCDVDNHKIGQPYVHGTLKEVRPVIHFKEAKPPVVLCVNLGLTGGEFEANVASMGWTEGTDFHHFA